MTTAERERAALAEPEQDGRTQLRGGRLRTVLTAVDRVRDRLVGSEPTAGPARSPVVALALFAVAVLAYPAHQLLTRGELLLSGAMWAEMGTNYFSVAQSPSLLERLFAPDAGYIPLPQRLIAFAGTALGLHPAAVPYLYTWAAILLAAMLIATICLPAFRPVIASDGLRFALAIAITLFPDYETRTFINFTYFAVVPLTFVTALAVVQRTRQVPGWAWVLPLFMLSKPGVLAVLPAMLLAAVVSRPRFRRIALASAGLALVQAIRLAVTTSSGSSLLQESEAGGFSKLIAALKYTVGFVGRLLVGPGTTLGNYAWMFCGLGIVVLIGVAAYFLRSRVTPLICIGLSLVLFTMAVNAFTFSAVFTRDMAMLGYPAFDRRFTVAVIGALIVAAGLIAMLFQSPYWTRRTNASTRRLTGIVGTALFTLWYVLAGWVAYAAHVNAPFGIPVSNVSQWQQMSPIMASGEPVVCVPLDPFSWVYGRNCELLVNDTGIPFYYGWTAAHPAEQGAGLELAIPREVQAGRLASLGVLVRPPAGTSTVVGRATVTDRDGDETVLLAEAALPVEGGLLQFVTSPTPLIDGVRSIELDFDQDVDVAALDPEDTDTTILLWMGQPGWDD